MKKSELASKLEERGVPNRSYSLNGLKDGECLCVVKENGVWKVIYNSRGKITDSTTCISEEAAYDEIYKQIADAYGW